MLHKNAGHVQFGAEGRIVRRGLSVVPGSPTSTWAIRTAVDIDRDDDRLNAGYFFERGDFEERMIAGTY